MNLLKEFTVYFQQSEEFQRRLIEYERVKDSDAWKLHKEMLLMMRGIMANEFFSKRYTDLNATEKDILQKTIYNINQIIGFLLEPLGYIKKQNLWKNLTKRKG